MTTSTPHGDVAALRREITELAAERDALAAQLAGDLPAATAWLQGKVWRQRTALDLLTRRVTSQRFALRLYGQLRPALTGAEWAAGRDAAAEPHRDRIAKQVPVTI